MNTFSKYGACLALLAATSAWAHIGIPDAPTTVCNMLDSTDLATHASAQIDARLTLAPSAAQSLPLFSVRGNSTTVLGPTTTPWTRNADFWGSFETPIDFTGFSAWHQPYNGYSSPYQHPGTLISPRHILMATHWRATVGTTMAFITADDDIVYRDVTNIIDLAGTDISIGVLDSDVPDTITYYPMIHDEDLISITQRFIGEDLDIPIVIFNQNGEGVIHKMRQISSSGINYTRYYGEPYSKNAINGDSSHPGFVIIDGRPVFLFSIYGYSGSYNYGNYIAQINAAMTTLGGGYQVTEYDTGCFDTYTPNTRPNLSIGTGSYINHPLTSPSDIVTIFTATDADVGQTLSLSLTGLTTANNTVLNPVDYFSATQVGNTLEIRHTAALDPDLYGATVTLTAQVADDVIGNTGTKTATKTLYIVEPSDPSVGFYTELTISDFFGNPIAYASLAYSNNLLYAFDQNSWSVYITGNDTPYNLFPASVGYNEIGIAADSAGNTYLSEGSGGSDFVKYDPMGNQVGTFGNPTDLGRGIVVDEARNFLYSTVGENFGSNGVIRQYDLSSLTLLQTFTTDTQNAYDIEVDSNGNIYTLSSGDATIRKYDTSGTLLSSFGGVGANDGQMIGPSGITIDTYDRVVVTDGGNYRIQMFDSEGNFIAKYGSIGPGLDQFNMPFVIASTAENRYYVSDYLNARMVKLYFLSVPTNLDLNSGYDSGDDSGDNITQSNTPVIDMDCHDDYDIEVYDDATMVGSATCVGDRASVNLTTLSDGDHTLTAKSTYLGNYSAVSEPLIITVDTAAPILAVVTAVPTPSTETSPTFTFSATEAGDVTLGGSCTTVTSEVVVGDTIITLDTAGIGTYSDCTLTVTDAVGNTSNTLVIPSFTITSPVVTPSPSSGGGGASIVSAPASPMTVTTPVPDASVEPVSTEVIPEAISLNSTAVVVTPLLPSDIVALPIWGRVPEYSRLIASLSDRIVFEKKQREATGFSYPFENPDIVAELQAVYGEAINQDIYESQCMTRAGDSAFRKCEIGFAYQTGYSFSENMLCEGFISKQPSDSQKTVLRQEALALAVGMRGDRREDKDVSLAMSDISGRDDWVASVVEKGLKQGIITAKKSLFKPENAVTRSEALAMMMKSVCMPLKKTGSDSSVSWQENIYRVAYDYGITQKSWDRFYPESHLKHSEMAVFASRLADWAERTGGCDPKPEYCFLAPTK